MNSFYTEEELKLLGLASYGENVLISRNAKIYGAQNINIGNNCWIGSNVIILKGVTIGNHCIIGANCVIFEDVEDNSVLINNQQLKNIKKVVK